MTLTIEKNLPASNDLPDNYLINLDGFSAIEVSGEEQNKYLQGQITCDVNQLSEHSLLHGAHCNAKGKMFSIFRLFKRHNSHWLLQPQATIAPSLAALQKFGIFAKVSIEQAKDIAIYALIGAQAEQQLKQHFTQIPDSMSPVIQSGDTTLIYITSPSISTSHSKNAPQQSYFIIDKLDKVEAIIASFALPLFTQALWNKHEIMSGFPLMNEKIIGEYVPQMLNVQAINGISFTKGCYLGQETVARMQYLGRNKRALFLLSTEVKTQLSDNTIIELQLGDNWRRAGNVLSYFQADNGETYLQAILASDINDESTLRLKVNDEQFAPLSLLKLPYPLKKQD